MPAGGSSCAWLCSRPPTGRSRAQSVSCCSGLYVRAVGSSSTCPGPAHNRSSMCVWLAPACGVTGALKVVLRQLVMQLTTLQTPGAAVQDAARRGAAGLLPACCHAPDQGAVRRAGRSAPPSRLGRLTCRSSCHIAGQQLLDTACGPCQAPRRCRGPSHKELLVYAGC